MQTATGTRRKSAACMCFGTVAVWNVRMKVLVLRHSPACDLTEKFLQVTTPCDPSSLTISSLEEDIRSLHLTAPLEQLRLLCRGFAESNPLAYANLTLLQTIPPASRLDQITFNVLAINLHSHRSLPSVSWDFVSILCVVSACAIFALSRQYICDFVVFLFAFSCVINVQQFRLALP